MAIAPSSVFIVMRSVLVAAGVEAPTSRSALGEEIVMNTAALPVPPAVSRAQAFSTSTPAGFRQATNRARGTSANATFFTAHLLRLRRPLYADRPSEGTGLLSPRARLCAQRPNGSASINMG